MAGHLKVLGKEFGTSQYSVDHKVLVSISRSPNVALPRSISFVTFHHKKIEDKMLVRGIQPTNEWTIRPRRNGRSPDIPDSGYPHPV
ncbi:uncharacterized protein PADG_12019 [Paracoccidioides brasiliensis Pb18]|uniref:Uncharacterized protein n=1 Tax=Paracoccidioides brasiliensis (strain Pb18) TaxID=502780 RepID=A0A0A0HU79_PARBD|nr:uncharacterized protein PADG_12019 [Paracoccidioides brasiliensis Pb18]KGM91878.1 hypothetical protein PADG_12019 [Paracoccidioides brasiliensis Pb18]